MSYELPSAPLSIGGVLDSAIRLYRHAIRHCWALSLVYAALIGGVTVFSLLLLPQPDAAGRSDPRHALALLMSPVMIVGILVAMVIGMAFYGALMKAVIVLSRSEEPLSVGAALGAGLRRVPGMLLGGLITSVATVLGFVALLIPGFYLLGKFELWFVAMFVEDAGALESIGSSWRLTRKRWWRGVTIFTVAVILLYVFSFAVGLVAGAIGVFAHLGFTPRLIVNQVFSALSNFIVFPMFVSVLVVMYHDFKLRSEGGDLAVRVGALGKA